MAGEQEHYEDSAKNLFQSLRDLADGLKSLELRIRMLEEKRIMAEAEVNAMLQRTDMQFKRLVNDSDSERVGRVMVAKDLKDELQRMDRRFEAVYEKLDKLNSKLLFASGFIAAVVFLINVIFKFYGK